MQKVTITKASFLDHHCGGVLCNHAVERHPVLLCSVRTSCFWALTNVLALLGWHTASLLLVLLLLLLRLQWLQQLLLLLLLLTQRPKPGAASPHRSPLGPRHWVLL